ncbi:MAG: M1 family metallopeptidase, partial [Verrucomicrobia bacterium]|nr:M1 family metallopeptidase [Verrucomicrobiota bacterium]
MKHFLALVFVLGFAARADSLDEKFAGQLCVRALAPAVPDSPDYRKYAPDRRVEILHLKLEVIPDFQRSTVAGAMTLTFKPIAKPLDELRLNGMDLTVSEVTGSARVASHQVTDREVIITFAKPVPVGAETKVTVLYSAQPRKGLYFRTPREGYRESDAHLWSQGEADEARHWFPCYDYPNAKFTSEITCSVPEGMTVLSNGRKVSETKDAKTGLIAVRWAQEKPHVSYLMALCAGHFEKVEDKHGAVALEFYTPPSDLAEAGNSLRGTRDMMAFYERETGVAYPWAEYKQVVVHDFLMGGMENTTMTILTDRTLHRTNMEQFGTSEGLVAHELAHQWFGDLVTCKDWSHIWLNEGFATFYAHLYAEHAHGRDRKLYGLLADLRSVTSQTNDTRGIVWRKYGDPQEMFNYLAYPKGSWVLHMLRSQLGEDLYRRCITTYLERHRFGNVTTDD